MADFNYANSDYIDVPTRIVEFQVKYPEGSLRTVDIQYVTHGKEMKVVYQKNSYGKNVPFPANVFGQPATTPEEIHYDDLTWVVVKAEAHRSKDDPSPGVGVAWERVPGLTPYTKNSELQNAETSAWGRAIVASLAAHANTKIASLEEVRNRQAERSDDVVGIIPPKASPPENKVSPPEGWEALMKKVTNKVDGRAWHAEAVKDGWGNNDDVLRVVVAYMASLPETDGAAAVQDTLNK